MQNRILLTGDGAGAFINTMSDGVDKYACEVKRDSGNVVLIDVPSWQMYEAETLGIIILYNSTRNAREIAGCALLMSRKREIPCPIVLCNTDAQIAPDDPFSELGIPIFTINVLSLADCNGVIDYILNLD